MRSVLGWCLLLVTASPSSAAPPMVAGAQADAGLRVQTDLMLSGGPAIDVAALEPHDPAGWRVHLAANFSKGRVEVGTRGSLFGETDDDQYFNGGEDVIRLVTRGRDVSCPLAVSASCAKAPAIQTKGEFTLVCLPQNLRHDGCASSGFSVDWGRQCVLFDAARATCVQLPFVDARLVSATRLEVEQTFSRLPRIPTTIDDVAGATKLGCGSTLCAHCPPDSLVRLELGLVDGGLALERVVGELTCGEQSCDRQTNAQLRPPSLGCPR